MPRGAEFSIAANYAKMIWPFVSTDKTRYFLNGFRVERHPSGGALIVATDGRALAVFHDEFGEVKVPAIVQLHKSTLAACVADCTLVLSGDRAGVYQMWNKETGEGILVAGQDQAVIEGDFPNWRLTIPPVPEQTTPSTFSSVELKRFEKVRISGSKIAALRIFPGGGNNPALVLTARDDFLGVIMPLLHAADENRMPQWMPRPTPFDRERATE